MPANVAKLTFLQREVFTTEIIEQMPQTDADASRIEERSGAIILFTDF
jgi:hypothetical protein